MTFWLEYEPKAPTHARFMHHCLPDAPAKLAEGEAWTCEECGQGWTLMFLVVHHPPHSAPWPGGWTWVKNRGE